MGVVLVYHMMIVMWTRKAFVVRPHSRAILKMKLYSSETSEMVNEMKQTTPESHKSIQTWFYFLKMIRQQEIHCYVQIASFFFLPLMWLRICGCIHLVHLLCSSPCCPHSLFPYPSVSLILPSFLDFSPQPCCWCVPPPPLPTGLFILLRSGPLCVLAPPTASTLHRLKKEGVQGRGVVR